MHRLAGIYALASRPRCIFIMDPVGHDETDHRVVWSCPITTTENLEDVRHGVERMGCTGLVVISNGMPTTVTVDLRLGENQRGDQKTMSLCYFLSGKPISNG